MGRIEEALAKLQADRSQSRRVLAASADSTLPARVPTYGGTLLELDFHKLRAQGLLAPMPIERTLAEEYRIIKRPILANARHLSEPGLARGNLVAVTSAVAGEGKTFTCINLCLSIARERDWNVVLVDADCGKAHLSRLLGVDQERGFMDLLRDSSLAFDALVIPTNVPGFAILPSGRAEDQAPELLASERMSMLCDSLASVPGRLVVFDSAPLLLTADAPVLSSKVGQVVLVVRADKTPQRAVLEARDKLDPSKAINALLNQVDERAGISGYGEYPVEH